MIGRRIPRLGRTAAAGLLAAGCVSSSAGLDAQVAAPVDPGFTRVVYAFEVRDSAGTVLEHPFLGGLNIPRPQLIDIDGDGDLDLFLQEYSDHLMFFENVGTATQPQFVWRTDQYADLAVGEWYRFVDFDRDGDLDLLAEHPFSLIRYYRNEGGTTHAQWVVAADTLKDVDGQPIFSDRQNIPNATDIDCDGMMDLFIGRLTGTVMRYEEVGKDATGIPRFRLLTDRFENIEIVAQIGSRHGANTMAMVDIDDDGDEDFFWGDFFEPGVLFIENTGTCQSPALQGRPVPYPIGSPIKTSGYNAPAFGDIDGDGDVDLFIGVLGGAFNPNLTTVDNLIYLENQGGHRFITRTTRLIRGIDEGSESVPSVVDWDGDGDLDLILTNKIDPHNLQSSRMYLYENTGSARSPSLRWKGPLDFVGSYHYVPAFADLDGDGDQDMILGTWRASLALYRNVGTTRAPRFTLEDSTFVTITRGSNAAPALVDIDGDGDFDLFVGEASGAINFYRNEGSATEPRFTLVSDTYDDIDVGRRSFPAFVDLDADGDFDMVVGSEADGLFLYRNTGTRFAPAFVLDPSWRVPAPPFATPVFADLDGDGDPDLLTGGIGGGVMYFENGRVRR
jgi:FG-GAP-like repeat